MYIAHLAFRAVLLCIGKIGSAGLSMSPEEEESTSH